MRVAPSQSILAHETIPTQRYINGMGDSPILG